MGKMAHAYPRDANTFWMPRGAGCIENIAKPVILMGQLFFSRLMLDNTQIIEDKQIALLKIVMVYMFLTGNHHADGSIFTERVNP